MTEEVRRLIRRNRGRGILLDANVLLLHMVGMFDRSQISSFKRTRAYAPQDWDRLDDLLRRIRLRVTLPNVLTEVSNLASTIFGSARGHVFAKVMLDQIGLLRESYVNSRRAAETDEFRRLGLTDAAILELARARRYLLLTDDLDLAVTAARNGVDVINFTNLRVFE
jgi:rRNA-processing protein FCF1